MDIIDLSYTITVGNIAILLILLDTYLRIYKDIRSNITLGFIVFTTILLLRNISYALLLQPELNPVFVTHLQFVNATFIIIPNLLEFIALCILLYLARE